MKLLQIFKKKKKNQGKVQGKKTHKNLTFGILGLVWNVSGDY